MGQYISPPCWEIIAVQWTIVEFALIIPATNTTAERVFSHINDIWTSEKGSFKMENLRARLMVTYNWKENVQIFMRK